MAQSDDDWPVVDKASTQFKNGILSTLRSLMSAAADDRFEPLAELPSSFSSTVCDRRVRPLKDWIQPFLAGHFSKITHQVHVLHSRGARPKPMAYKYLHACGIELYPREKQEPLIKKYFVVRNINIGRFANIDTYWLIENLTAILA